MRNPRPNPLGARVVDSAGQHIRIGESGPLLADQREIAVL
jgi:hypothetical protein